MARTAKRTKAVTVATVEDAAEVVAALPAPEPEAAMTAEVETVADAEAATGTEIFIPLNKLKKSPRNARKTPHSEAHIEALAASIAAKGLFQNLVVEPEVNEAGEATGFYFVTIGEGRRQAQLLRVKRKEIKKTEAIRCILDTANDPQEISLDENVTRANMHPADQFEAFRELAENRGWGAAEISTRFGVSEHVVKQRLRLGAVSLRLMQLYRDENLTLDQLQAFAITDDHARQEQVYAGLGYNREPWIIRRDLTRTHVQANDRKAIFVGPEAYTEAGGYIVRDLFSEDRGGYYDDPALLDQLVLAKLEGIAADIQAEGWKWAEAFIDFPHTHGLRRVYPQAVELSEEDEAAYAAARKEFDQLTAEWENTDDELPADVDQRFAELEAEMERIEAEREGYGADQIAGGGVLVCLNHDGTARIERGFVRPEDEAPEPEEDEDVDGGGETVIDGMRVDEDGEIIEDGFSPDPDGHDDEQPEGDAGQPISDILTRDLTAHRTLGLRLTLGEQPDMALIAVTHALAAQTFYLGANAHALEIRPISAYLASHADGIEDTAAAKMLADRHAGWASDMPQNVADLWDFIAGLDPVSVMALFAHCASLTVNALKLPWEQHRRNAYMAADRLATALALDMSQHWTPTVSAYLGRVAKTHILAAMGEALGDEVAKRLSGMKKQEMAEAAEQLLAGTGWLPPLLRTEPSAGLDVPQVEAEADTVATVPEAPETAEPEEPRDLEAMAFEMPDPDEEAPDPDAPEADEPIPDTPDPDADLPAEPETAPVGPDPDAEDGGEDVDGDIFHDAAE
ncbi:chromosome partitioning protein ParB [Paramesorhizobium deserti]|uniref:Chromosome partitioning protein ParB n=1 Tax=Paramesorhizobium deserti TaxID=1494590 RepID=A0A135I1U7_9HYPH|nr:ParB/Srx family N-terminal domain-containing protein [Paramesorhizobium deserti]KXF79405.1 chromosome partitioning protein ParB [Paramesorhizobium deserti]